MKNAVIYARYSAGPRQTDQSIEGQIADCKRYAEQHDLNVVDVYADRHISGKSTEGRDEFLRMIKDAKKGMFQAVIVWKVDRFGRDKTDIAIYKRELRRSGVTLHYAAESVPEGPEGIILESLLEGLAEYYSADLRQKVNRGMTESLKKGQYPGRLPYGYTKDKDKKPIVDEEKAAVVREVFALHIDGKSIAEIERIFANKGIYQKNGSIYRILTNEHYTGKFEMMGIEVDAEPIISAETWVKSQEVFGTKKRSSAKMEYLLSGKCTCGICGGRIQGSYGTSKTGDKHTYYICPNKCIKPLSAPKYEKMVFAETRGNILTDEMIGQIVDRIMEIQNDDLPHSEIKRISAQISDYQKRLDNLYSAIENGLNFENVKDRLDDYTEKISTLSIELEKLKAKKPIIPRDILQKWLEVFRDGDIESDAFAKRIINTFISGIVVYEDHSVIAYNITDETKEAESSSLLRLVNQTQVNSNSRLTLILPYALLWMKHKV
jgi:DNA invertase Pin-like site-specific DNA recombinase